MKTWQITLSVTLTLIIGLSIGIGLSYNLVNNTKKDEQKSVTTKSPDKPTQEVVKMVNDTEKPNITVSKDETAVTLPAAEIWTGEITLRPKDNSLLFEKVLKSSFFKELPDNCGAGAKVFYKSKDSEGFPNGDTLKITNRNIEMSENQKLKFNSLYNYIKNEKTDKLELTKILFEPTNNELIFSGYCKPDGFSIGGIEIVDEIKNIKINNIDYAITLGNNIYAIKGDNLLKYSGNNITDQSISIKYQKECQAELNNFTNVDGQLVNCISKKSIQLPGYQKQADQKVQQLLTIFAL